jgi:hypothetical protein
MPPSLNDLDGFASETTGGSIGRIVDPCFDHLGRTTGNRRRAARTASRGK